MVTSNLHASEGQPEAYTVPVKSASRVIAEASPRVRPSELCEAVGLDARQLSNTDCRIPLKQLVALYEAAAHLTNDRTFGLRVGARADFRTFGVFGYIITNSATLEAALNNAVRYFPLWTHGALFRTEREGVAMRLIWEYVDPGIGECRHDSEMTLFTAAKLGRLLLAYRRAPREVHFRHSAPRHSSEHRRLFGTPSVHFRMSANQLIFDREALVSPLDNADPELCSILVRNANDLLAHTAPRQCLTERTQIALRRFLPNREPLLAKVASSVGMSSRTLQRQLRAQGFSFRGLLDKLRRELAAQYLRDHKIGIDEIASLLGYAETSEFYRAFRTWTGTTPRRYKRANASY
jgi:AraC-like DNA-binding protein